MNFHTLIIHEQVTGQYYFLYFSELHASPNLEKVPPVVKGDLKQDF